MNKQKKISQKTLTIVGVLIILAGLCGLLYPIVGNILYDMHTVKIVDTYQAAVDNLDENVYQDLMDKAEAYNERVYARGGSMIGLSEGQYAEYDSMLRVAGSDIMGYLEIPKIHQTLPIYHGTSEEVLQIGVGHLEWSSLPIGGNNVHTALTSHSGLPSTKLFTDLDQLEAGDIFTITVLNNLITYQVDGSEIMLPEEIDLHVEENKDLCTLITCTPIGVNTHRLLVYAHRIQNLPPVEEDDTPNYLPFVIAALVVLGFVMVLLFLGRKKQKSSVAMPEPNSQRGEE